MENFFYNDKFYSEIEDLIEDHDWDEDYLNSIPDGFKIKVIICELKPIIDFSTEWIMNMIDEERFSEDNDDNEYAKIEKVLKDNIDFEKINSLIPKLYYPTKTTYYITKEDLLLSL